MIHGAEGQPGPEFGKYAKELASKVRSGLEKAGKVIVEKVGALSGWRQVPFTCGHNNPEIFAGCIQRGCSPRETVMQRSK